MFEFWRECVQIRIYFPQLGHPAFGVVRALVKDATEQDTAAPGQTFLDTDGNIGQLTRNTTSAALRGGSASLQVGQTLHTSDLQSTSLQRRSSCNVCRSHLCSMEACSLKLVALNY